MASRGRSGTGPVRSQDGAERSDADEALDACGRGQRRERVFAGVALHLDELDDAGHWYRDALEWAEREGCPVEAGRCHQGLAEVAERHGEHAEASEHLDRAGELFSRHGAKLYLDQVLAKKEILKA